jgi:antitoxin MazE
MDGNTFVLPGLELTPLKNGIYNVYILTAPRFANSATYFIASFAHSAQVIWSGLFMELNVSSWGNSLGLRIPKSIAEIMGLGNGSKVTAKLKGRSLILSPRSLTATFTALAKTVDLEAMVSKVTVQNRPSKDLDSPVGNEVW